MKCYYEILSVPRDADDSEIKSSYRKLALRWHPDKNLDDPEEAKEQFQLVQQAYEVLSDPQERAWYDNHREQILRGKNSDYQENCLDLFQYFTVSCFKGYGDDPGGFYHVYAEVFEKIATEDVEFMDDEEEIESIPKFGDSKCNYEEIVGPFYAYWQSYCTKKSYAWLCPYNINEIKDRRILREIEKDMKKVVQKAKRERNEEVRNLVSFVRKRDKRVQNYKKLLEEKAALNRKKQEQNRLEQLRKRKKDLEELQQNIDKSLNESYEEQLRQLEQEYEETDSENNCSEDELKNNLNEEKLETNEIDGIDGLDSNYCIACNKSFSNENAFLNHELSKKHKINVEILKESFRKEKEEFDQGNIENNCDLKESELENEEENDKSEENDVKISKQKNRKSKKSKKPQLVELHDEDEPELPDLLEKLITDDEENVWNDNSKLKKKQKSKKGAQKKTSTASTTGTTPTASTTAITTATTPITTSTINSCASSKENNPYNNEIEIEKKIQQSEKSQTDYDHSCVTCKAVFESKNKLFAHLKKTDHGVYISKKNTIAGHSEKIKKGKRNK